MKLQKRFIRVFISSTFRDMHAERDYLIKYVFPELGERCLKQGLNFVPVDLRWGVTEEEAEKGKALEICLDEIENCRPFFIGLIGERYGWVPQEYQVPEGGNFDWLKEFNKGHSITALEIYQGVLKDKDMRMRSFFYFRDPGFIQDVPPAKLADIEAESPESAHKLYHLKENIKDSFNNSNLQGHYTEGYTCRYQGLKINWPLVKADLGSTLSEEDLNAINKVIGDDNLVDSEEYHLLNDHQQAIVDKYGVVYLDGLEEFGNEVLNDLWKAIEQEYPFEETESEPLSVEISQNEIFAGTRIKHFVGRKQLIADISAMLYDHRENAPLFICGDPGSGKTALMAKLALETTLQGNVTFIQRFCGITANSTELDLLLKSIMEQLSRMFNIPFSAEEADSAAILARNFQEMINGIPKDATIFIFIDAVDQLSSFNFSQHLKWLPVSLPGNVRFVFSAIDAEAASHAREMKLREIKVPPLTMEEKREIVSTRLWEYRKKLGYDKKEGVDQMEVLLQKEATQIPLYLVAACEELRVFPRFEEITIRIRQLPDQLTALMEQILGRMESDHDKELVARSLSLIECSLHGLNETELLKLLKRSDELILPQNLWARLFRNVSFFLTNPFSSDTGLIRIFHRQFSLAIQERYLQQTEALTSVYSSLSDLGMENFENISIPLDNTGLYTGIYLLNSGRISDLKNLLEKICHFDHAIFNARKEIFENVLVHVIRNEEYNNENSLVQIIEKADYLRWSPIIELLIGKADFFQGQLTWPWAQWLYELMLKTIDSQNMDEKDELSRWYMHNKARVLANYSLLLGRLNKTDLSVDYLRQAISIRELLLTIVVKGLEFVEQSLAGNYIGLSTQLANLGRKPEALAVLRKAIPLIEKRIASGKIDAFIFETYLKAQSNFILLQNEQQIPEETTAVFEKAEQISTQHIGPFKHNARVLEGYGALYNSYSFFLMEKNKDVVSAKKYMLKAIDVYRQILQINPDDRKIQQAVSTLFTNTGLVLNALGEYQEAERYLISALEATKKLYLKSPDIISFKENMYGHNLGLMSYYYQRGDHPRAALYLFRAFLFSRELYHQNPENDRYKEWYMNIAKSMADYYLSENQQQTGRIAGMLHIFVSFDLSPRWLAVYYERIQDNEELVLSDDTLKLAMDVCKSSPDSLTSNLIVALLCFFREEYSLALPFALKATELGPDDDLHISIQGVLDQELHIKLLDSIKSRFSDSEEDLLELAGLYDKSENYDEAADIYKQVLETDPQNYTALLELGNTCLYIYEAIDEARNYFEKGFKAYPEEVIFPLKIAKCYEEEDEYEIALKWYFKVLKIEPDNFEAVYKAGSAYFNLDDRKSAIKYYNAYIEGDPGDQYGFLAASWLEKGITLYFLEKPDDALYALNQAITLDNELSDAHYYISQLYNENEQYDEAYDALQKAVAIDPENVEYRESLINVCYDKDNFQEAISVADEILLMDPDNLTAKIYKGYSLMEIGQYDDALHILLEIDESGKSDAMSKYKIANIFIDRDEDYKMAIHYLDGATELYSEFEVAFNDKSWCYKKLGQYERAIEEAEKAISLDTDYDNPYFHKAESLYALGHKKEAIATMKIALEKGQTKAGEVLEEWLRD